MYTLIDNGKELAKFDTLLMMAVYVRDNMRADSQWQLFTGGAGFTMLLADGMSLFILGNTYAGPKMLSETFYSLNNTFYGVDLGGSE